jgi:uncharacterized membrane protein
LLVLDGIWLSTTAKSIYQPAIGHLMSEGFALLPGVLFYLLYALVVAVLVVVPAARERRSPGYTFLLGALLGLGAYGTYDLTNQATLRDWPLMITIIDMAWGSLVTGLGAVFARAATRSLR